MFGIYILLLFLIRFSLLEGGDYIMGQPSGSGMVVDRTDDEGGGLSGAFFLKTYKSF